MTETPKPENRSLLRVPLAAELPAPKPADLLTEITTFLRNNWNKFKPFFDAISGEIPSIHGSQRLDEAACVFEMKEIAKTTGFTAIADLKAAQLRKHIRTAFKRITQISMRQLESQGRKLRLQHMA